MPRRLGILLGLALVAGCQTEHGDESESLGEGILEVKPGNLSIDAANGSGDAVTFCSFNIQFLGARAEKDNAELSAFVKPCDIIAVQELVATPTEVTMPGGAVLKKSALAAEFTAAMADKGFAYLIAPEDTGYTGNHDNTTRSEFPVVFYRPERASPTKNIENAYLSAPLVGNDVFDRVPFAFHLTLKTKTGKPANDFVLVSVHLHWDSDGEGVEAAEARRRGEIAAIMKWMAKSKEETGERDYLLLGDMNIRNDDEIAAHLKVTANKLAFRSLNLSCTPTNTKLDKCYDQVIFSKQRIDEIEPRLYVTDIAKKWKMESFGTINQFSSKFSDHNLIWFRYKVRADDD